MKNPKVVLAVLVVVSLVVAGYWFILRPAESDAQQIVIKVATVGPEQHQYTIASTKFKEIIERTSNGRIQVQLFPNAQLGSERVMAEGVRMGTIEMAIVTTDGALPAWVPEAQIFSIAYLFRDNNHVYRAMDGELGATLARHFEERGFKHLGFAELGWRHFTNNVREIRSPEDMRNMKIRVQEAPVWFALIESLNATPTPIAFTELYTALQQGAVDGQENPLATIRSMKFYEVQKFLTLSGHTYAPGSVIMNPQFFNGLSDANKRLIVDAVNEMVVYQRKRISDRADADLQYLRERGMVVTVPDRAGFTAATQDIPKQEAVRRLVPATLVEMVLNIR